MEKEITIKIDEDNDIYEMRITSKDPLNGDKYSVTYTLDNVYQSKYGNLWDELNMSIEITN